jgi:hypothetical protein
VLFINFQDTLNQSQSESPSKLRLQQTSSTLGGLNALRLAAARKQLFRLPSPPHSIVSVSDSLSKRRRRLTYIPLKREAELLQAETCFKSFRMSGGWQTYGSQIDSTGRRVSGRLRTTARMFV